MREKKNQFIKTDPKNETDDRMGRHGNSYIQKTGGKNWTF